jgi:hypothetical protein
MLERRYVEIRNPFGFGVWFGFGAAVGLFLASMVPVIIFLVFGTGVALQNNNNNETPQQYSQEQYHETH